VPRPDLQAGLTFSQSIDVDDSLTVPSVSRIVGSKDVLEQAVLTNGGPVPGVRSFVGKWCPWLDSNQH
jgi:hypothetical protein